LAGLAGRANLRVLIGGLGMGYTLAAALRALPRTAEVVVAELVPAIVAWNRELLADLAGRPLDDARVSVREADVADVLRASDAAFDAILLDVDNGPDGLTRSANQQLYAAAGLAAAFRALRAGGVLGVWSVAADAAFTRRLHAQGFAAEAEAVRARTGKGGRHTLWLARRLQPAGAAWRS
jgi:spermidine synthase